MMVGPFLLLAKGTSTPPCDSTSRGRSCRGPTSSEGRKPRWREEELMMTLGDFEGGGCGRRARAGPATFGFMLPRFVIRWVR